MPCLRVSVSVSPDGAMPVGLPVSGIGLADHHQYSEDDQRQKSARDHDGDLASRSAAKPEVWLAKEPHDQGAGTEQDEGPANEEKKRAHAAPEELAPAGIVRYT